MAKRLSGGGKPAQPPPKRFYIPPDLKPLLNWGNTIVNELKLQHTKRMTVDVYRIVGKRMKKKFKGQKRA